MVSGVGTIIKVWASLPHIGPSGSALVLGLTIRQLISDIPFPDS